MVGRDTAVSGVQLQVLLQACLHNTEEALAACKRIGYPIMLKASWGGGGKGIRKARPMFLTKQDCALTSVRMGQGFPVSWPCLPAGGHSPLERGANRSWVAPMPLHKEESMSGSQEAPLWH